MIVKLLTVISVFIWPVTKCYVRTICINATPQLTTFLYTEQVGEKGVAVGVDHIDELVQMSIDNVNKAPETAALLKSGRLQLVVGDGRLGYDKFAPYDAIHVGAAAAEIPKAVSCVHRL